jgi:hypothetical protein
MGLSIRASPQDNDQERMATIQEFMDNNQERAYVVPPWLQHIYS